MTSKQTLADTHRHTVCFFVLCNRHWFAWVPGSNLRIACLPSTLTLTLAMPTHPYLYWLGRFSLCRSLSPFASCGLSHVYPVPAVVCRVSVYFFFKVTGPSPFRGQFGVRQKGGLPGPPPEVADLFGAGLEYARLRPRLRESVVYWYSIQ